MTSNRTDSPNDPGDGPGEDQAAHPIDQGLLRRAADLLSRYRFEFWNWGDSIGFEGLFAATDLLEDERYEGWVHGALKAWAASDRPFRERDNTAPGHAMCLAYERTSDDQILERALQLVDFLTSRRTLENGAFVAGEQALLRPPYGGEPLPPDEASLLHAPGAATYVDAIHMDPPLYTHLGSLIGDESLVDLGAEQLLRHLQLLQDQDSGLMWHFFLERTGSRYCHGWGRGQGWAMLGILDVLEYLPRDHPHREELEDRFARLAQGLADFQTEDGGWATVVTDPLAGPETSTAAFATIAFLQGCNRELLPSKFMERGMQAWDYTCRHVRDDGALTGVSAAVYASTRPSHYPNVPTGFVVPWGQGPLLIAAHSVSKAET